MKDETMARFDELVSSVGFGEDGATPVYPDTFLEDIKGAYAADMEIPDAAVTQLTVERDALIAENTALKAEMYTLVKQIPAQGAPVEGEGDGEGDDDIDDDDDPDVTTDELFDDPDDNK